ncbi:unnamed protein product [Hermetia illucens]|uniref:Programmed cell death protein 2 C-terminal domain-containing protein n=1 Tax=Hermetia illucens TaxID=343691 RepID=A0A7R8V723_HERIL|nr:programmed cell death protein 2-like [Hermetia illucens]CAD7093629.1 unnamed protein product [Hermetia illucens]
MAKNKGTVYLGFEDEFISEKYKCSLNYLVNKVGGLPDWPSSEIVIPNCPICNLTRPLIMQIYAPLDNSQFHRTLYIFACLSPTCSNVSKSWLCVRTQILDKSPSENSGGSESIKASAALKINWCSGADDWGEPADDVNRNEENGNVIKNDNRISDDDDESNSMENDIICGLGNVNIDDKNANCGAQGGAIGAMNTSTIYAEIEGEEFENVTIETPTYPERDLVAMLKQTPGIPSNLKKLTLRSFFVSVCEEKQTATTNYLGLADHVRELIQEYQFRDENCRSSPDSPVAAAAIGNGGAESEQEAYEHAVPAHGDVIFHNFMSTIQDNPGQIIRYSRDTSPLLPAPLTESVPKCPNCGSDTIPEVQILPTLIPKLRLENGDAAPIEYGNVLVFTCLKSCWDTPDKMRMENVIVQPEL